MVGFLDSFVVDIWVFSLYLVYVIVSCEGVFEVYCDGVLILF